MRRPRVQFTVRWMVGAVVLTGLVLAGMRDLDRRGYPLVVLDDPRYVDHEPLVRPTRLLAIEADRLMLEDGRVVRIDEGPLLNGYFDFEDPSRRNSILDVETGAGGTVTVHTLQAHWSCGVWSRRRLLPLRIPLFPRTEYRNYRALVGTGTLVR